ncbi:MAG: class I SAM-dependent methyltransferase [Acidimicrobiia bacterium]|nr:class I SAM-dependent methyltransferase [Acidimicrobiia bacterium]
MGSLDDNRSVWTEGWDWSQRGDEWSGWWGGTAAMWYSALLPRIHAFVPAGTTLELAPGFGRWTQYLKDLCDRLIVVDLAQNCIDACRERFRDATNIAYHINDGRSLTMIDDESVDFVFSFDSLVHADTDVIDAYLSQLRHKLTADGVAFIHHSNAGAYRASSELARRLPPRWAGSLMHSGVLVDLTAWRSPSVTGDDVITLSRQAGLSCVAQERLSWENGYYLTDAISIVTRQGSRWDRPLATTTTRRFALEARRTARLYARSSFAGLHR